jgi:hypothetical protein
VHFHFSSSDERVLYAMDCRRGDLLRSIVPLLGDEHSLQRKIVRLTFCKLLERPDRSQNLFLIAKMPLGYGAEGNAEFASNK